MDKLYGLIQDINPKEICNHIENGNLAEWCNAWRIAAKEALQPKTNADRIRAMNDEEFSCFLALVENRKTKKTIFDDTSDFWLEWLKQPAEEETQTDCTYNKNGHCIGQKLMPECDAKNCYRRK